jgi:hypothetical protein
MGAIFTQSVTISAHRTMTDFFPHDNSRTKMPSSASHAIRWHLKAQFGEGKIRCSIYCNCSRGIKIYPFAPTLHKYLRSNGIDWVSRAKAGLIIFKGESVLHIR